MLLLKPDDSEKDWICDTLKATASELQAVSSSKDTIWQLDTSSSSSIVSMDEVEDAINRLTTILTERAKLQEDQNRSDQNKLQFRTALLVSAILVALTCILISAIVMSSGFPADFLLQHHHKAKTKAYSLLDELVSLERHLLLKNRNASSSSFCSTVPKQQQQQPQTQVAVPQQSSSSSRLLNQSTIFNVASFKQMRKTEITWLPSTKTMRFTTSQAREATINLLIHQIQLGGGGDNNNDGGGASLITVHADQIVVSKGKLEIGIAALDVDDDPNADVTFLAHRPFPVGNYSHQSLECKDAAVRGLDVVGLVVRKVADRQDHGAAADITNLRIHIIF